MIKSCDSLLIEFLVEELPPLNLYKNIGEVFANVIMAELKSFMVSSDYRIISTPRRFGVLISKINDRQTDGEILKKGPAINTAIIDGNLSNSIIGFMKSLNVKDINELIQIDGYFFMKKTVKGELLNDVLYNAINKALKSLIIAKNMKWADNDYYFVRPVHNLMIIFGSTLLDLNQQSIFGLHPTNYTYGHRVLANKPITIIHASDYFDTIWQCGYVISDYHQRLGMIKSDLLEKSKSLGCHLDNNQDLLAEVTSIVEYPVVLVANFDKMYLQVPSECLILSMAKNQKYFALFDNNNQLSNTFLFVTNISTPDYSNIINGNQRVLNARLADAKFFYDVDKKLPLEHFVAKLDKVVYHHKLGTQLDRVERIQQIASIIGMMIGMNSELVNKTAYLLKADLMTDMVSEFPELQGVMGRYYAKYHKMSDDISNAIQMHYYPRFSGDDIPNSDLAVVMALADKLETIIGIWGIGLIPTGDKDQYALRRIALGIIRILFDYKFDIKKLLTTTFNIFSQYGFRLEILDEIYQFILTRLYHYLSNNHHYKHHVIQSVIKAHPTKFNYLIDLIDTVDSFSSNIDNKILFNANKRIENILKKIDYKITEINIDENLFKHNIELQLYQQIQNNSFLFDDYATTYNWSEYFKLLGTFNHFVTEFFDNVMIMDEDFTIRTNRINLLIKLYTMMNKYCKLSELDI